MVVDTSALAAIVFGEPERELFMELLTDIPAPAMSAVTWTESQIVIFSRIGDRGLRLFHDAVAAADIQTIPVTQEIATAAFNTFRRYGKGRHAAGLNFGDCFAYALAKATSVPLLFKGNDFSKTDIVPAVPSL